MNLILLLVIARGVDLLTTWLASPTLAYEYNPVVRHFGWAGTVFFNWVALILVALINLDQLTLAWILLSFAVILWNIYILARYGRRY